MFVDHLNTRGTRDAIICRLFHFYLLSRWLFRVNAWNYSEISSSQVGGIGKWQDISCVVTRRKENHLGGVRLYDFLTDYFGELVE